MLTVTSTKFCAITVPFRTHPSYAYHGIQVYGCLPSRSRYRVNKRFVPWSTGCVVIPSHTTLPQTVRALHRMLYTQ